MRKSPVAAQIHNEAGEARIYRVDVDLQDEEDLKSVMTPEDEENLKALGYLQ